GSRGIGIAHGRSKECTHCGLSGPRAFRVDYYRSIDSFREKADPPIDLAQPPLAILIVGVLTAIAVARSPCHHFGHCGSFPCQQKSVLLFEALQAGRRDVVLDPRGGRVVALRFSGKTFSHTVGFGYVSRRIATLPFSPGSAVAFEPAVPAWLA